MRDNSLPRNAVEKTLECGNASAVAVDLMLVVSNPAGKRSPFLGIVRESHRNRDIIVNRVGDRVGYAHHSQYSRTVTTAHERASGSNLTLGTLA